MRRLTADALEALAAEMGRQIEVDRAGGIAILSVAGRAYCADLAPLPEDGAA